MIYAFRKISVLWDMFTFICFVVLYNLLLITIIMLHLNLFVDMFG